MSALNAANHTIAQATSTQGRVPPTNGISAVTPPTAIATKRNVAIQPSRELGASPHPKRFRRNQ